jgi:putative ABC transport system substrate-binding protein
MRRRVVLLAPAFAWSALAFAQTGTRRVRIAFLSGASPDAGVQRNMVDPFVQGLRALGYVDGQNTTLDWRRAEGRAERLPVLLAELLRLEPDVLVAAGPRPAELVKKMGPVVPVVALVDKILRGSKPADIPFERASKLDLVINLKGARAIGITVPQALLLSADEVLQ